MGKECPACGILFSQNLTSVMNMKQIKLGLLFCLSLMAFWACSDDDNPVSLSQTEGLITFDPAESYLGSHEVTIQQSGALEFYKVAGVQQSDEFIARNVATGENIYLDWGYKYAGLLGDEEGYYQRDFSSDTIMVGLGFKDNWVIGDYDLLLVRDADYQVLDRFNFCVLKDIETDLAEKTGGVIKVYADGWLDVSVYGTADSLEFVSKSTGEIIEKIPSSYKAIDETDYQLVKFTNEKFATGDYEMWINRWGYNFRQKICEFDWFQYGYVNSDPIVKAEDGNYYIQFYIDQIGDKDTYAIVDTPDQEYYYADGYLDIANWDPETKIYRLKLEDKNWMDDKTDGLSFEILLTLNGIDISVVGSNKLELSE